MQLKHQIYTDTVPSTTICQKHFSSTILIYQL